MAALRELADVIRSKNAGPFELTFDVIFSSREAYLRVKASKVLTRELICRLYGVEPGAIVAFLFSIPRKPSSSRSSVAGRKGASTSAIRSAPSSTHR